MTLHIVKDLRPFLGPVRDQGRRPTCLSFAASAALHVDEGKCITASVYEREEEFMAKYDRGSNEESGKINYDTLKLYG